MVKASTTTTVTSSYSTPSGYGHTVRFTATVSAAGLGAGTPTGTVTFSDGSTSIGTGSVSSGLATFPTATLPVGTHTITASYGGDASFNTSTSGLPTCTQSVNQDDTSTAVTSSFPLGSHYGDTVTFTATVSTEALDGGSKPTGTVTFSDGTTLLGTGTLSGTTTDVATLTTSTLTVGTHTIRAIYSGDNNFKTSDSQNNPPPPFKQTVGQVVTNDTLISSANPSVVGQNVTFTATIEAPNKFTQPTPTGTVTFSEGSTSLGMGILSGFGGTAQATLIAPPSVINGFGAITRSRLATAATATTSRSATLSVTQTVNKAGTTTAVIASSNPSTYGDNVSVLPHTAPHVVYTATVSSVLPGAGTPATGTVTFMDGGLPIGTGNVSDGVATYETSNEGLLPAGNHSITAIYSGNGNFKASPSSPVYVETVNQVGTTTTVIFSANPSPFSQDVTLTANLYANDVDDSGVERPTDGTVMFLDNGLPIPGVIPSLVGGFYNATLGLNDLSVGTHSFTAVYSGDTDYSGNTSSIFNLTISQDSTTTVVTSSSITSSFGQNVTFTATISHTSDLQTPLTGTVTFKDGGTLLGTGMVSTDTITYITTANYTTTSLTVGTHTITAVYGGDANYAQSPTSSSITQIVNKTSTTTTVTNPVNPSVFGQNVTFTATVSPNTGMSTPTGIVTFIEDGTTTLGTAALSGAGGLNGNATATFNTSSMPSPLSAGTHTITAIYGGDGSFTGDTQVALSQTVNQAAATVTLTSSLNPVKSG